MQHDLVLEGKVVRPSGIEELQVGVSEGKISELRRQGIKGTRKVRADRCLIFPGFVDIHVHLREPGWEYKEDFGTGTKAAIHGGVTTVVDMPNNPKPATTAALVRQKIELARAKAHVRVSFFGGVDPSDLKAVEGMKELVVGYKIYLSSTTGSPPFPEGLLRDAIETIRQAGLPVSLHCEDQSVIDRASRALQGMERNDLHSDVRPPEAEEASVAKAIETLRGIDGIGANVCHASTANTLAQVSKAAADGMKIQCEATMHHLYFDRRALIDNPLLRTNPPLRSEGDRQAMLGGLTNGAVSFLVTDHAPHTEEEKATLGLAGVPGLDDYAHLVAWLIRAQGVDPVTIARLASSNPSQYAGMRELGEVTVGKGADFSVIDLGSPEIVKGDGVRSKCGWSPYEGKEFPGRARWTIVRGELLMDDYEIAV